MAYTTVAETIVAALTARWTLIAPLSLSEVHLDDGWFDKDHPNRQITIYGPIYSFSKYFGPPSTGSVMLSVTTYDDYEAHVWVRIPRGSEGDTEEDQGEQLRREIHRILNQERENFTLPISLVYPLSRGEARHEYNQVPKIVHYVVPVRVVYSALT